ncbi:hypothetical protein FHS19_000210 [Paenibacillus rhizosphaerae]|uniref:Uncharacterized protein n=1 Tax=Paenibacillus rhizosphaerae TaxID=297318 RepID=A0A839TFE2_9BACL|nr:hypothetical protein [Paenibacillus rhizosphaerae]
MRKPWAYFASTSGPEFKKVLIAASLLATIPVLIMGLIAC